MRRLVSTPLGTGPLGPVQLCDLYDRKARAFARRPSLAAAARHGRVLFSGGLAGRFDHPSYPFGVDLTPADGGSGTGPDPFDLAIASLCTCYGTCARIWAARSRIELLDLSVGIRIELDARGALVADGSVPANWQRVIVETTVSVPDPGVPAALEPIFAAAASRCPLVANLHPAIERVFRLTVLGPSSDASDSPVARFDG